MKKIFKAITSKLFLTFILLLVQLTVNVYFVFVLSSFSIWIELAFTILSGLVALYIINKDINPSYKLAWIFPMMILPIFGASLYFLLGRQKMTRREKRKIAQINEDSKIWFEHVSNKINTNDITPQNQLIYDYIKNATDYRGYANTYTKYFSSGESYFEDVLKTLKIAKKYIFIEFFIIGDGVLLDKFIEILSQKVKENVDVRVLYDDLGSLFTLSKSAKKRMKSHGIKLECYNRIKPAFDVRLNNRSHRKIICIDGDIAYTGGMNLADEYINEYEKFGHWKDTGMKFIGDAAWSFSLMFYRAWESSSENSIDLNDIKPLRANKLTNTGYIVPIMDGPGNNILLNQNIFMQIINRAQKYVYINTPYLILDNEMVTALVLCAKSGIDVRITLPHIPDKKTVFMMSRSFYPTLLKAGVKIYEYTPGFNHAKSIVSDNHTAYIGTCNFDYRSFYLHFECGAVLFDTDTIKNMKDDYLATVEMSHLVSYEEATDVTIFTRIGRSLLRVFAPLL